MPYDCRALANAVLDLGDQMNVPLTHMAVHKVMYYAHGWHLAKNDAPLVEQEFEAWKDGPVQRLVWEALKTSGSRPITQRVTRLDIVTRSVNVVAQNVDIDHLRFLRGIVAGYGSLHAFQLSEMTHEPGGPWDRVWNASHGRISVGMRISNESIREHFQRGLGASRAS
jgi:uncharacterized phage-associated protein